ncbi:hypothetical protein EXT60_03275 [Pectobacterium carotovorum subsp. carotovorum]|nr:hypothetical protein [Pectobacterium carotovorum]MCL6363270.1 hypothetical protein [Pectobacterium carotovorum subsp. carotovorum]
MKLYLKSFIKTLTASDVDRRISNQHEFHGVKKLEDIFGIIPNGTQGNLQFNATIQLGNSGGKEKLILTWYNARANTPDRHEYRLYYRVNGIINNLCAGDCLLIGQTITGLIELIIFKQNNNKFNEWTPVDY